VLSLIGPHLN